MRTRLAITATVILCVMLSSGCGPGRKHWGPQPDLPRPLAQQMDVELRVPNEELGVALPQSDPMAAGGGLIGVLVASLVDGARARGAEARVASVRNALAEHDYRQVSRQAVETHLDRNLVAPELTVELLTQSVEQSRLAGELQSRRNVLVLEHTYYFTAGFGSLQVELNASLGDRRVDERGRMKEENMRFFNRFFYNVPLPAEYKFWRKDDERIEIWMQAGPEFIDAAIREGMRETVEMLNYDLAAASELRRGHRVDDRYWGFIPEIAGGRVADEVHRHGDRVWARGRNDPYLYSLPPNP